MDDLVSIIVPVFNGEAYIGESIKSVISQSHKNWELLVVNDGSTDGTREIVLGFSDSRIRYFEHANQGVSVSRNVGLKNMQGNFFCFLDADDRLPEHSLSRRLPVFAYPDIDFVDGRVRVYDSQFKHQVGSFLPTYEGPPLHELLKLSSSCFYGITWMIRKLDQVNYQFENDMKYAEDLFFYAKLATRGSLYSFVNCEVYDRRMTKGSATSNVEGLATGYVDFYNKIKLNKIGSARDLQLLKRKIRVLLIKIALRKMKYSILRRAFTFG